MIDRLIAVALLAATPALAAAVDPALFPQAAGIVDAAAPVLLHLAPGRALRLTPVRFVPRAGVSQYGDTHFCGVVLDDGTHPPQPVVTIGTGETETLMCGALLAAGVVRGTALARIGLIYRTDTPRSMLTTPIVLGQTGQAWAVDWTATAALDRGPPIRTIADVRRRLTRR